MNKRFIGKVMQWTLVSLTVVILGIVCITPWHTAQAALTKTTTFDTIDAWQALAAGTLAVGNAEDVSGSYSTILYIEVALTGAAAQSGCDVIVEISYATGDDWIELVTFQGTAETPGIDDVNDTPAAGETTITLTDALTDDFDVVGRRWFIQDTTVAESEVVRTKSIGASDTVTLCQDLKYTHADAELVTDRADQWPVTIPFGAAFIRTIINNSDADAGVHWRSYCSKVSAL